MGEAVLNGCRALTEITLPFIGARRTVFESDAHYPLGYIFGGQFTGGVATEQTYSADYSTITTAYYIPRVLATVNVTGGTLYRGAFTNCGNITTINLRDGVESVESNVFDGCGKLTEVNITSGLTAIGSNTFENCAKLQKVTISETVTTIGYRAFAGCTSLAQITLPASVTNIESNAFEGCTSLTGIKIPSRVKSIGYGTFRDCTALESVELPVALETIGSQAFYNCVKLQKINIPDRVSFIDSLAFYGTDLRSVVIPEGMETIAHYTFGHCENLTSVTIPESVIKIESYAFANCYSLASIELPEWLYSLGEYAFENCTSLKQIVIPADVEKILPCTFYGCSALEAVTLGEYTTQIGNNAFVDCTALKQISFPDWVETIGSSAFSGCTALTQVTLPEGVTTINEYTFHNCTSLESITLGSQTTEIGYAAFSSCSALKSIDIPDTVTSIGSSAFSNCVALTSVDLPDSLTTIAEETFYNCDNLTQVDIPAGVTSIGRSAFSYCENLETLTLPSSLKSIGVSAFSNCTNLKSMVLPEGLTTLGDAAFYECSSLKLLDLPSTLTSMSWGSIRYCSRLERLIFRGNAPTISAGDYWSEKPFIAYYPAGNTTWTESVMQSDNCPVWLWLPLSMEVTPEITVDVDEYGRPVLTWDAMEGAASYHIYRHVSTPESAGESGNIFEMVCNTAETTYIDTNITPGYTGQYRVVAVDENGGCSFLSNQVDKTWILAAPAEVSAKLESYGIQVSWSAVPYAECYGVYRAESPDGPWEYICSGISECSYYDPNVTIGTTYYYKVTAYANNEWWEECGHSDFSFTDPILKRLGIPGGIRASSAVLAESYKSYIQVSWYEMGEAAGYEVYRADTEDGEYTLLGTITGTHYYDSTAAAGNAYYYKVRALHANSEYDGDQSAAVRAVCQLSYPQDGVADCDAEGNPILSWEPVEGAIRYELYYIDHADIEADPVLVGSTTGTSITVYGTDFENHDYEYYLLAVAELEEANRKSPNSHWLHKFPAQPVVSISYDNEGRILLTWDATEGAEAYNIYYSFTEDGEYSHTWSTTDTSYLYEGEGQGKTIYFKVTANHNYGSSKFSEVKSATWKLSTPPLWEASNDGTGIRLVWGEMFNVENYVIYRSTSETSGYQPIGQTIYCNYLDTAVEPGCTYYYKVQATNANPDAASALSNAVSCTSALASPTPTITYDEATGYPVLSWTAVEGAAEYVLYENDSPIKTTTKTSITIEKFTNGDFFYYLVAVGENGNRSEPSDYFWPQSRLAQPVVTASKTASSGCVKLKWNAVAYSDAYIVYRATSKDGDYEAIGEASGESTTSYTDSSAKVGTTYYYKVMAYSDGWGAQSAMSEAVSGHRDLAQPSVTRTNTASSGNCKLSWNAVSGATKYYVYRSTSSSSGFAKIATTTKTAYTDTTGKLGTKYYYKIRACYSIADGNSAYSNCVSGIRDLPAPVITRTNTSSTGNCKLSWEAVDGAVKYTIYRSTSSSSGFKELATTKKLAYTDTSAKVGTKYYYKIKAIHSNSSSNSAYSNCVSGIRDLAAPVIKRTNTASTGQCKLSWSAIDGATRYYVYRSTSSSSGFEKIASTTKTAYTDTSAKVGTKYYYKIKAIHSNSSANSAYSNCVSGIRDLARPDVSVTLSSKKPKLSWSKISGATKYYIYRSTSKDGEYEKIASTTSTSYTDKTAKSGKTYYYKVMAIHKSSSANSAYSAVDKIKVS